MYVCMYVYMYTCMYVCVYLYLYVHMCSETIAAKGSSLSSRKMANMRRAAAVCTRGLSYAIRLRRLRKRAERRLAAFRQLQSRKRDILLLLLTITALSLHLPSPRTLWSSNRDDVARSPPTAPFSVSFCFNS